MGNSLLVAGAALDLRPDTEVLPSFQFSDLLKPDTIQSDFSPEVSVPGTVRNHALLGQAAYDGAGARVPYKSLAPVLLLAEGAEIMPRGRLYVKGYTEGNYQVQLFGGNRRFIDALGDKTLQDLDFARFAHAWEIGAIAQRATAAHWAANGWGYELYDRGRQVDLSALSPYELWPSVGAQLLFEQMVADAGFTWGGWMGTTLLEKARVPAVALPTVPEAERTPRRLRVSVGPGHLIEGGVSANRDTQTRVVPFDDASRNIGTVPPLVPTVAGIYDPTAGSYRADRTGYYNAAVRVKAYFSIEIASAGIQVFLYKNGAEIWGSEKMVSDKSGYLTGQLNASGVLLQAGDTLTAVVKLKGEKPSNLGTKWGFKVFSGNPEITSGGEVLPLDKFEVSLMEELAPGGVAPLAAWLPAIKQVDFFKAMVQLGGLRVAVDAYTDHLSTEPSAEIVGQVNRAFDWSAKRDTPPGPRGTPRNVAFKYGTFAQRNAFRWAEDETVRPKFGDGTFLVDDANLPATADMLRLPFAATEPSPVVPGLLLIRSYTQREEETAGVTVVNRPKIWDPRSFFNPTTTTTAVNYDRATPKPRLTLASERTVAITLVDGSQRRSLSVPVSHFNDVAEGESLALDDYVLPRAWAGLRALLMDCRAVKERYRLTPADLAAYLAEPGRPVWDAGLGGFYSVSKISEYSARRPVEVEMLRLHPALLDAPTGLVYNPGNEFFEGEFFSATSTATPTAEFY